MGKVRTFYGHEGIVPPHGLIAREAGEPAETFEAEELVLPTTRSKVSEIDDFISARRDAGDEIDVADDATKPEKLDAIQRWADSLPQIEGKPADGDDESDDNDEE